MCAWGTAQPLAAQTNHGGQIWGSIQVTAPLSESWFVTMDLQPRVSTPNAVTAPVSFIGPIVSHRPNESIVLSGGYLYAYIDGARLPRGIHEDRFLQQIGYRLGALGRFGVRALTRLEQRRRSNGQDWNLRVAQTLLVARPLTKKQSGGPVGVLSTELYWNLNGADWGARPGYDDLWTFAGVQLPVREDFALELGYLNQRQARLPNGVRNMNHAAVVAFQFRLLPRRRTPPVISPTPGPGVKPGGDGVAPASDR